MAKESESSSRKSTQIMTHIINIVQKEQSEQTMTSLEIAELTGKQHKDLLRAIRKMEIAWVDVTGRKFALRVKINELANGVKIETPYYLLTKTECLYIATKFNDEARAKLVIRWEELERAHMGTGTHCALRAEHIGASPQCALLPAKEILAMADEIIGEGLRLVNADAEDTLTATQGRSLTSTRCCATWAYSITAADTGISLTIWPTATWCA